MALAGRRRTLDDDEATEAAQSGADCAEAAGCGRLTDRNSNPRRSLILGFAWSSCQVFCPLLVRFRSLADRVSGFRGRRFFCRLRVCRFSASGLGRPVQNRRWRRSLSTQSVMGGRKPTDIPDRAPTAARATGSTDSRAVGTRETRRLAPVPNRALCRRLAER